MYREKLPALAALFAITAKTAALAMVLMGLCMLFTPHSLPEKIHPTMLQKQRVMINEFKRFSTA
ncbi:exported protein of unknown function [Legionella micdadei]|uniref:Uncharacterized protein n=1 Tax=Legionella micdadei TaxID=451 RepID=A0A098GD05_LEGMI|nr:exported protein of unknown function [Legionella micdadei]